MVPPLDAADPFYIVNPNCTPPFLIPALGVLGNQTSLVSGLMIARELGKCQLRWASFALQRMFSLGKRVTCAALHMGSDNTSMIAEAMGPYMNRKLHVSKNQAGLDNKIVSAHRLKSLGYTCRVKMAPRVSSSLGRR